MTQKVCLYLVVNKQAEVRKPGKKRQKGKQESEIQGTGRKLVANRQADKVAKPLCKKQDDVIP